MTLWTLVIASVVYPLLAHVGVARGKNVGDVLTEIQIERTVYISADWCADAEIGKAYPAQIDKELGWAQATGMTTMRVFLHDALWQQDAPGFQKRIDTFLTIAAKRHIKPIFVLFDSCWDPDPKLGPQRPPIPVFVKGPRARSVGRTRRRSTACSPRA